MMSDELWLDIIESLFRLMALAYMIVGVCRDFARLRGLTCAILMSLA